MKHRQKLTLDTLQGIIDNVDNLVDLNIPSHKNDGKILCYIYRRASQRKKISERLIHLNHRACIQ